jgi:hypothetical protein
VADVVLDDAACVRLHGKGRSGVPLWRSAVWKLLAADKPSWSPVALLPNRDVRDDPIQRLTLAVQTAATQHAEQPNARSLPIASGIRPRCT